jgi:hypothetical protein
VRMRCSMRACWRWRSSSTAGSWSGWPVMNAWKRWPSTSEKEAARRDGDPRGGTAAACPPASATGRPGRSARPPRHPRAGCRRRRWPAANRTRGWPGSRRGPARPGRTRSRTPRPERAGGRPARGTGRVGSDRTSTGSSTAACGRCANARSASSTRSAVVLTAALPWRRIPASGSAVPSARSRKASSGWNPKPPLNVPAALSLSEWASTRVASRSTISSWPSGHPPAC